MQIQLGSRSQLSAVVPWLYLHSNLLSVRIYVSLSILCLMYTKSASINLTRPQFIRNGFWKLIKVLAWCYYPSCALRHMQQCDSCSRSQIYGGIPAQLNYAVRSRSATLKPPIVNRGEPDRHKFTGVLTLRTTGNCYRGILG